MTACSLFNLATGQLTGMSMLADDDLLALNTPAGHAWVDGEHDPERVEVRLVTDDFGTAHPVPVSRVPPRPADSAFQTWSWDDANGWVAAPTLLLLKSQAGQPVLTLLAELDGRLARPSGEVVLAQALGQAAPAAAVQRLQAIEADKTALRARLTAINAAESAEALAAVVAEPVPLQTSVP